MKKLLALVLSLLPFTAGADVFSKYAPVAGIQKSTGLDYHNTAAAASDVTPLFGCGGSSTLFLRGDGSCAAPAGTGVSSVSVPVPLTASSCSGGACSITWTTGQTANRVLATPDGTTGAVALRALAAGDVPPINLGSTANGGVSSATILLGTNGGTSNGFFSVVGPATALRTFTFPNASATVLTDNAAVTVPQGGTGLATLTAHGVLLGEGTSTVGIVAAMAADTLLQGRGVTSDPAAVAINNCGSATTALSYSTSTHTFGCQTITSGGTGSVTSITGSTGITASPNPIVSAGTLTVDQGFSPTWTGTQVFQGAITAAQTSGAVTINSTTATNATNVLFQLGGVAKGRVGIEGSAGGTIIGSSAGDLYAYTNGGNFLIAPNSGSGAAVRVSSTGNVTISTPTTASTSLVVNGAAGSAVAAMAINGANSAGSRGLQVLGGTSSSDFALIVANAAGSLNALLVYGDGGVTAGTPTGGDKGLGTVNMTGCYVNNVPCLTGASTATRFTAGVVTIGASTCTVNQNTSGIPSCTFNSTGNVTVNFSSAFTAATCVANAVNANPTLLASQPGTSITTSANVILDNTSGTATNGIFSILCLGT